MRKTLECSHRLVLLRKYFLIKMGQYYLVTLERCYKCHKVIQKETPVSANVVNNHPDIKLYIGGIDDVIDKR